MFLSFMMNDGTSSFFESFLNVTKQLLSASVNTLGLFAITIIFAVPLGFVVYLLSTCKFKPIKIFMRVVIWIIRGTPLMLQLLLFVFAPGLVFGITVEFRYIWIAVAFIINYSAYFSEIYRGGFESIPVGQYEACKILGMTKSQTFFKVITPQVVKRVIPPMSNEIITLVKDTSLAQVVGGIELAAAAGIVTNTTGAIWPIFYTGVFYLVFSGVLTLVLRWAEKKLDYYR